MLCVLQRNNVFYPLLPLLQSSRTLAEHTAGVCVCVCVCVCVLYTSGAVSVAACLQTLSLSLSLLASAMRDTERLNKSPYISSSAA